MIDTSNKFLVTIGGQDEIRIQAAPDPRAVMSRDDALNLAAWLVALAGPRKGEADSDFAAVLKAVLNT